MKITRTYTNYDMKIMEASIGEIRNTMWKAWTEDIVQIAHNLLNDDEVMTIENMAYADNIFLVAKDKNNRPYFAVIGRKAPRSSEFTFRTTVHDERFGIIKEEFDRAAYDESEWLTQLVLNRYHIKTNISLMY